MTKPTGKQLLGLVGNPDAYAAQNRDGSWTPFREPLTAKVIKEHRGYGRTIGTYIVKPPNQARTLVFDIDAKTQVEQDKMLNAVTQVLESLGGDGMDWGVEFSGGKGYHVWVVAEDYMDATVLYQLGRGIREEAGYSSLEVFPKQTEVRDLGSLVKLPGGVHAKTGKHNDFIGNIPSPVPCSTLVLLASQYPEVGLHKRRGDAPDVVEYPCVHDIQSGVKEGGRNIHLFHLAVMLRRWSLVDENVEAVVRRANEASDDGPLPEDELLDLLDNSRYSGPLCSQLDARVHCGEQCILARHAGLYTRPGSLKWAGNTEKVVIEVLERTEGGTLLELGHPDMIQGRAVLADPAPRRKEDRDGS